MTYEEIISKLQAMTSEKHKANVAKMGIPQNNNIGVSTADIRKLAKSIHKSNELALELWDTGYHEAKLLATLIFHRKSFPLEQAEKLMNDVYSWDLCDSLCKNLLTKLKGYEELVAKWCTSDRTYTKRAAFSLMASAVINDKTISYDVLDDYLRLIQEHSYDERDHVKKAVSWALREIGKTNFDYQEKAIILAYELKETGNKTQVWIAKDALKELEKLVKIEERGRLISTDTKMGKGGELI